ncbi:hypothetical protein COY95_04385 [Candidatus Woesearchaeota archaeon CG_4_10_14_0_8_um_filter_47_5]|nr:MAG: hypothetical protein COY95_04385 [Candidatus Woesearchaeota archaeon CG_4_10_14_0_8_um_filter_47_5]
MDKKELCKEILEYNPHANTNLVEKAYDFAQRKHTGQKRVSGEDYFTHILEVVKILVELKADSQTICAGFLHDVIEDSHVTKREIRTIFGQEVLMLIEGVTKIKEFNIRDMDELRAENIRKIVLATLKDIRVILIKLADRLHNMRTLKYLPEDKRKLIAKETLDIYAPIAYKLGMYSIKSELEDLSLKYLEPSIFLEIKANVVKKRPEREREVEEITKEIKKFLEEQNIHAEVYGRAKNFYSIYKKIVQKGRKFEEIYDLIGVRVVVRKIEECYLVLGIIHAHYKPIPNRFKDYIAFPKPNLYQSIHTEIFYKGQPLEIQIRTKDMHLIAEQGIAAHWRYKGTERDKKFEDKIGWLRQILDWKMSSENAQEFIETLKIDLFEDEIYVFTPKGDPIALPEGATPVDFAYTVHTEIGNLCSKAKVNGKIVPLDEVLKSGDICEIITDKKAQPSRNWLKFVKTPHAKSKIRVSLNIKGIIKEAKKEVHEQTLATDLEQLIVQDGHKKHALKLSKCCAPVYGDTIVGIRTTDGKVTVHKKSCKNVALVGSLKVIPLHWEQSVPDQSVKKIRVFFEDRVGLMADVLNIISGEKINILSAHTKKSKGVLSLFLSLDFKDSKKNIDELVEEIKKVPNVNTLLLLEE